MPFTSKAQMKKCFAMKGRGQAKGWNCEEWAHKTPSLKKLPEHAEMFGNSQGPSKIQRDEEFWSRRRGVNPDIPIGISRPLIEMVDIDESIFAGQQVAEPIPPPGQIPESDHEQTLTARWARVNRRWEKLFGETEIPAVRNPDNVLPDLEQIEAMLYDKESKGINPKRCPCCRYVIGCRRKGTL